MELWNKVSRMPAAGIRKMQEELLAKMLQEELAVRHPYYISLFKENNLDPSGIKSIADLEKIPFTEKKDVVPREGDLMYTKKFVLEKPDTAEKKGKKKGLSLFGKKDTGTEIDEYRFYSLFYSAGRTAKPTPFEYTQYDIENLQEAGMRTFDVLGLSRDDTVINAFTYAPNVHFWQMFYSTINIGSTALQTGGGKVLGLEKILKALDSMEAPVLIAAPGYAMFALRTLEHFGFSAQNLERIVTGIDYTPLAAVERIKELMQSVGAKNNLVHRVYFVSEAKAGWGECEPGFGYHTYPDHVLFEVVDPESGKVLGEGEKGELVVTNLDARGTVLLRYKTGDIATGGLVYEPCPNCKRTVPRIMGDIERKEHHFELQGKEGSVNFNANELRKMMFSNPDVLLWYVEIERKKSQDSLKLVVKGVSGTDESQLNKSLEKQLQDNFKVPVSVENSTLDAAANKIGLEKFITEQNIFDLRSS